MFDAARFWKTLKVDGNGLVTAVVQHHHTKQVLMVGYMNESAVAATLDTKYVTFWSRSRQELWKKGETSGNTLAFVGMRVDCDSDALLVEAIPAGPTCHTGATSCFYRSLPPDGETQLVADDGPPVAADAMFTRVFQVIEDRKAGRGATQREGKSYVRSLLDAGPTKIASKITEESQELIEAVDNESADRVASECADLFFHAMVALAARNVDLDDVAAVFAKRFGTSGLDEKARRPTGGQ